MEVRLFGHLRDLNPEFKKGPLDINLELGNKLIDLISKLEVDEVETLIIMVNGKRAALDAELNDGDRIGIFPPVGGG